MKRIQDTLALWSTLRASEGQISDAFMQFSAEFNACVQAFGQYDVDTSDIHPIPADLRYLLETCLGEEPSPKTLAIYMPEIRQLLFDLLHGLRSKQAAWRAVTGRPPVAFPTTLE